MTTTNTPEEINDAIRKQVEAELPRPVGGFELSADEWDWKEACERRFFELVKQSAATARVTTPADKHNVTLVKEKTWGKTHEVREGAPCAWSAARGATHTLWLGDGPGRGTRPARLLKTVLYVGVDEGPGETILWEKWSVRKYLHFGEVTTVTSVGFEPELKPAE